ncbi:MAG: hypothetical protein K9N23_11605 [Akkermansiaceae bacterium]|nr:hypothetical protein [Akkermansiaceae bacterium]MCF7732329.1 hypothetical protein [Akkermansiaceae bacterium]
METNSRVSDLLQAIKNGRHRIGEIEFRANNSNDRFVICHHADTERSQAPDHGGLEIHHGPEDSRRLSLYAEDGSYRFLKAQRNLRSGWLMLLESPADLKLALDQFYPAALGLWLAHRRETLEIEHLRQKLDRQSGMYRRAKMLTDEQAQSLVPATCAAAPGCARRILWQISPDQPLAAGPASSATGIADRVPPDEAIPLLCAAPCNHFIAECLATAKKQPPPPPSAP